MYWTTGKGDGLEKFNHNFNHNEDLLFVRQWVSFFFRILGSDQDLAPKGSECKFCAIKLDYSCF